MNKSQLHEVIAASGDAENAFKTILQEAFVTFDKKENLFQGFVRDYRPFDENEPTLAPEINKVDTTVDEKLKYITGAIERHFKALEQIDRTNQVAVADLVINGVTIATNVPATFLLSMEKRLKHIQSVLKAIPTLQPGTEWVEDENERAGVYKTKNVVERFKTKKDVEAKEISPATKEHKAQVEVLSVDRPVGKYTEQKWSGAITPRAKSQLLERFEKMIVACKQARQRANCVEVVEASATKAMLQYLLP